MIKCISSVITMVVTSSCLFAKESSPSTEDKLEKEIAALDWKGEGTYKLPNSHSKLVLPENHLVAFGRDAQHFHALSGNPHKDKAIEAVVIDEDDNTVYFTCYNDGYVSLDDWKEIDSKKFLEEVIENTEEANKERRRQGMSELHVVGWLKRPTLDRKSNTVYWAIEAEDDDSGKIVNSVALRLGRKGFERIVWVSERDSYRPFGGELDVMMRAHSFEPGYRYSDFIKGDKVATYGIAALVAATLGTKVLKATGLLVLFKKFGAVIFAGLATLFYKARNKLIGFFRKISK